MNANIEVSVEDWQKLIDLHEKIAPLLLEAVDLLQAVAYSALIPEVGADASKVLRELEPLAKMLLAADSPFGVQQQDKQG